VALSPRENAIAETHTLMAWLLAADPSGKCLAMANGALARALETKEKEPG
jgi:hypothetical protein